MKDVKIPGESNMMATTSNLVIQEMATINKINNIPLNAPTVGRERPSNLGSFFISLLAKLSFILTFFEYAKTLMSILLVAVSGLLRGTDVRMIGQRIWSRTHGRKRMCLLVCCQTSEVSETSEV